MPDSCSPQRPRTSSIYDLKHWTPSFSRSECPRISFSSGMVFFSSTKDSSTSRILRRLYLERSAKRWEGLLWMNAAAQQWILLRWWCLIPPSLWETFGAHRVYLRYSQLGWHKCHQGYRCRSKTKISSNSLSVKIGYYEQVIAKTIYPMREAFIGTRAWSAMLHAKEIFEAWSQQNLHVPARYLDMLLAITTLDDEVNWEDGVSSHQTRLGPFMIWIRRAENSI